MSRNLILHFRPQKISTNALRFTLTWGLGGIAVVLILQQLITGLLLNFFYKPLPIQAYESVQYIRNDLFLGRLIHNIHHWTGHVLVVIVFLHMLRVFMSGAFYSPRRTNWFIGLGLALLILFANFSGYLLPWDQLSYWAVTIATSMLSYIPLIGVTLQEMVRGGEDVGGGTLQLFYSLHTAVIPMILFLFMAYHFWCVRKAGGVLIPEDERTEKPQMVAVNPELLVREIAVAAAVICVLLLFSMGVDAPLGELANPAFTPPTVKAPWYFLGAQELLLHIHPLFAVIVFPLALALFLIFLPFTENKTGKPSFKIKVVFLGGVFFMLGLTLIGIWFRGPGMVWVWPW